MTPDEIHAVEDDFLARLDAGQAPDLEEVVLAHPEAAAELFRRLTAIAELHAGMRQRPVIAGYEVFEPLGSGGQATVYRATDSRGDFDVAVAVKVFHGDRPVRFGQEVAALTALDHPNIVRLLGQGLTADGRPYLSMPLFPNGSLDRRFPVSGSLSPTKIAELTAQVADAVRAAHQHKLEILHRDIKPSNVLIGVNDFPRLSDFGLAQVAHQPAVTRPGAVVGSPLYMAPEQAAGNTATVRTDVYGLGTVLYWLLTGQPPSARLALTASAPPGLEVICRKCLESDPADRYPTAAAVADDLRGWLAGKMPRGPGLWECARKWWRRRSPAFRAVVVAATVILAVLAASGLRVRSANRETEFAQKETRLAETVAAAMAQARAQLTVRTALDRGWQRLRAKQVGWTPKLRADLAEAYRASRDLPEADREEARLEARSLFAMSLAWTDIEPVPNGRLDMPLSNFAAWPAVPHPDGKWIAVGTPQGPFRFQPGEVPTKPEKLAAPPPGQGMPRLAYRPDGQVLAFAPATGGLQLWDGAVSRKLADLDAGGPPVLAVGFAPGVIRACRADGRVISWGLGGWGKLSVSAGELTAARFTPDATRLVVGDKTGRVRELTADGRLVRDWVAPGVRTEVQALAWKPDSHTPAAGFKEGVVIAWNAVGVVDLRIAAFNNGVEVLDYTADGTGLYAFRTMELSHLWDASTGERLLTSENRLSTSPDGRTVAISKGHFVELGRWSRSDVVRVLRGHRAMVDQLVWPARGDFLASLDARREVRVWDVTTGRRTYRYEAPVGEFYAANAGLALSPDGRFLAYACGGPPGTAGFALIRDTQADIAVADWKIPPGYDRLAWEAGSRFRLVREEFDDGTQVLQTVVRTLEPERPPTGARVLRRSLPTDAYRQLGAMLTADGRYYIWYGPREPENPRRAEVYDVPTGKLLMECQLPLLPNGGDPEVRLAPWRGMLRIVNGDTRVWKLPNAAGEGVASVPPDEWFRGDNWFAQNESGRAFPSLFPPGEAKPWLRLGHGHVTHQADSAIFSQSQDGRRLAWATPNGVVLTADLQELVTAIQRFEVDLER